MNRPRCPGGSGELGAIHPLGFTGEQSENLPSTAELTPSGMYHDGVHRPLPTHSSKGAAVLTLCCEICESAHRTILLNRSLIDLLLHQQDLTAVLYA